MGSVFSGRHFRERKLTTNDVSSIDIRDVSRRALLSTSWTRVTQGIYGDLVYIKAHNNNICFGVKKESSISVVGHAPITWSPRHFGGTQPYFVCPEHVCGRRAAILYLSNRRIACRTCSRLSYESQHESKHIRTLGRAERLRQKIEARPLLLSPMPDRPKGMHHSTYDQISFQKVRA